ncbi:MAG: choice-of-anchor Q domain-containing protein, partial [Chloroflexota bacterium]
MKRTLMFVIVLPLLSLMGLMSALKLYASPAQTSTATFTVNSTIDATDANPGNGICETGAGNGVCTLRAAVQETNALAGADVINLPSGIYTLTIPGNDFDAAMGDLNITDALQILGESNTTTIVDGNNLNEIFDVQLGTGQEVTMADLTMRNGSRGIFHSTDDTKLYLYRVIIREHHNEHSGGGIYNQGYMEVISSTIQENIGGSGGGGIYNSGTAIIHQSIIVSNSAPYAGLGGGIYNSGILTLTNSIVKGNSVLADGWGSNAGGVYNSGEYAEITIENSTLSQNTSQWGIGGFGNYWGVARLINVTISENDNGGVIQYGGGRSYITNTSIISNFHDSSAVSLNVSQGEAFLANTIIAGETSIDNCIGSINSSGNNLESGNSCGLNSAGDITNTNPFVEPLQWNGGDTQTHALQPGSPAIDAGNDSACPSIDQRGATRPSGLHCDIGAYEFDSGLTAIDDTINTTQNIPVLIPVLENDLPGNNGDPFLDSVGTPMSGTAVISGTFVFYTPTLDILGTDIFSYTISDGVFTSTANI